MSQKGRLRRLDAGVRWLETEGAYIRIAGLVKSLEMLLDIADRVDVDPAFAADWKKSFPYIVLPPPRRTAAACRTKAESAPPPQRAPDRAHEQASAPQPVIVPEAPPSPKVESPPPVIEARAPPLPPPRPPPVMPAPMPMPGMPVSPPSPDMEIRPVRWRQREPQDYYDDAEEDD